MLATVAEGDAEDIDRAVAAARRAFYGAWSKLTHPAYPNQASDRSEPDVDVLKLGELKQLLKALLAADP